MLKRRDNIALFEFRVTRESLSKEVELSSEGKSVLQKIRIGR